MLEQDGVRTNGLNKGHYGRAATLNAEVLAERVACAKYSGTRPTR